MLRKKTVFVVGAGASHEFELPVGTGLALNISNKLDIRFGDFGRQQIGTGDYDLFDDLRREHRDEIQQYQQSAWVIRDGIILANSIDDFLDLHQEDQRVVRYGKSAIVKCVLEAEAMSTLSIDKDRAGGRTRRPTIDFRKNANTWLVKFIKMLGRNVTRSRRDQIFDSVAFIVFNYDRCIEHFLLEALQPMYRIDETEAAKILEKLRIVHPYGVAGKFPPLEQGHRAGHFGITNVNCWEIASQIKTYSESIDNPKVHSLIAEAECIVFLGFAFHEPNLRILSGTKQLDQKEIYGTAWGISENDVTIINRELMDWFVNRARNPMTKRIRLRNELKCSELFDFFSKSL